MTIIGQSLLQRFHLLSEPGHLLPLYTQFSFQQPDLLLLPIDQFFLRVIRVLVKADLLSQHPLLLSQMDQFSMNFKVESYVV